MKRVTALILSLALMLLLTSCAKTKSTGAFSLTFPLSQSPSTIDPQVAVGKDADIIINNCFEGLVRYGKDNQLIPGVAESWEVSENHLKYTFHLRDDARWLLLDSLHEDTVGEKTDNFDDRVTANDFIFAFQRAVDPATGCPEANRFSAFKNATAIMEGKMTPGQLGVYSLDSYTLVIQLEKPCVDLLDRLTTKAFMPCNKAFFELTGGRYGMKPEYVITNGPFYVKLWDSSSSMVCTRSKVYSGEKRAASSSITFSFNSDIKKIADKISDGSYCGGLFPNPSSAPQRGAAITEIENAVYGFCFNMDDEIAGNKNMRLAICSCVNTPDYPLFDSMTAYSNSTVPPCCTTCSKNYHEIADSQLPVIPYSLDAGTAYFKAALTQLEKESITLEILCCDRYLQDLGPQLQLWEQSMGSALQISLTGLSEDELDSRVESGDYQIALAPLRTDSSMTSEFFASFSSTAKDNIFNLTSEKYDSIADSIFAAEDEQGMLDACFTADCYLLSNAVFYPLFVYPTCFATADGVRSLVYSSSGNNVTFIWAEK